MSEWYPSNKQELQKIVSYLIEKNLDKKTSKKETSKKEIHGVVVPHAGYAYSGEVAGKTFSFLKNSRLKKAIVIGPSHYAAFKGFASLENIETPLGKMKITENIFPKLNYEHSIQNQIPFLQTLGFKEIFPLVIGQINSKEAKQIAEMILSSYEDFILVFSSDLSHFLSYEGAVKKDRETIKAIENLDANKLENIENSACGIFPLMILIEMCKIKRWKPKLVEYKNSGDITNENTSVVGYAGFIF